MYLRKNKKKIIMDIFLFGDDDKLPKSQKRTKKKTQHGR